LTTTHICILQWSQLTRTNPTCPICKQPFTSLIHSMTSEKEFRVHYLERYSNRPNNTTTTSSTTHPTNGTRNTSQPYKTKIDYTNALRNSMYSDILMLRRAVYPFTIVIHVLLNIPTIFSSVLQTITLDYIRYARKLKAIPQSYHTFSQRPQLTPQQVKPEMIHKIRPWITRELTAITGLQDVSVLTELIISLLTKSNIYSTEVHKSLQEFLGDNVDIFVHELVCFACSSHKDVASYDKYVRYDKPTVTYQRIKGYMLGWFCSNRPGKYEFQILNKIKFV
jgi:E3 ubiquitin-protein ligase Topors